MYNSRQPKRRKETKEHFTEQLLHARALVSGPSEQPYLNVLFLK